jgi:hypothetical protein
MSRDDVHGPGSSTDWKEHGVKVILAPSHAGAALEHVDDALERAMMVRAGLGVGVDRLEYMAEAGPGDFILLGRSVDSADSGVNDDAVCEGSLILSVYRFPDANDHLDRDRG